MEDAGYRPPKVKREPHDERFEAVRPNHLWHLDFVHRNINRATTFTLILIEEAGLDRTTTARRLFALDAPATGACMLGFAMYKIGELARAD